MGTGSAPEVLDDRVRVCLDSALAVRVEAGRVGAIIGAWDGDGHLHVGLLNHAVLGDRRNWGGSRCLIVSIRGGLSWRIVRLARSRLRCGRLRDVIGISQLGAEQHLAREGNGDCGVEE